MALRNLRVNEDPLLRKKSKIVKEINKNIIELLDDMIETMRDSDGLGLAAPQVGVLRRVAVVEVDEVLYELINPVIESSEGEQTKDEGCLSIPGMRGTVVRPEKVVVKATNRLGEEYTIEGEKLLAVALCHEIDHLDGILYKDKALEGTFRELPEKADIEEDEEEQGE